MSRRSGLTLIEVLVVVAIIGILFSILLPVLSKVKQRAYSVQCVNNLRQLFLANTMYADENNGRYCPAAPDINDGFGGRVRWHGRRETADSNSAFDPRKGLLTEYMPEQEVLQCPVFMEYAKLGEGVLAFEAGTGGYGYNAAYVGGTYRVDSYTDAPKNGVSASSIGSPVNTIMFADAAIPVEDDLVEYGFLEPPYFVNQDYPKGCPDWGHPSPSIHFRHLRTANVIWCDGHVTAERFGWTTDFNIYNGNNRRWGVGWFRHKNNYFFDSDMKGGYPIDSEGNPVPSPY